MPTYEYACAACGNQWEEIQRITAPPTEVCPKCSKSSAHRLISGGTNFILKGGGWYSDLYSSSKGATKKVDSAGGTPPDSGGKAETPKTDASKGDSGSTKSDAGTSKGDGGTKSESKAPATPQPASSSS
jgi:putative FmdB family regulatory protein